MRGPSTRCRVPESAFLRYVGDPDFHDGQVLGVDQADQSLIVQIQGGSGRVFRVEFGRVVGIRANRPIGMLLYALSEFAAEPPLRRFAFANGDEESDSVLEVEAESISVRPE
jgi:hypothetical protein